METEETATSEETGKNSMSYPYKNFETLLNFVQKIYDDLGPGIYHSKDQIAAVHNLAPNSIKQLLSSTQQFGLLEIKHGTGYKTTDLFAAIILPDNDDAYKRSILEALRKCSLYNELILMYEKSGILPNNTGLSNTLQRSFKFNEELAQKITRDFVSTLKNFSFLDDKNILRLVAKPIQENTNKVQQPGTEVKNKNEDSQDGDENDEDVKIEIPFGKVGGGLKAKVFLPKNYDDKHILRVIKFLNALLEDDSVSK